MSKATDWRERITADPAVMSGKPVVNGTRVPVEMVLDYLAQGRMVEHILENYPRLRREDVLACVAYRRTVGGN